MPLFSHILHSLDASIASTGRLHRRSMYHNMYGVGGETRPNISGVLWESRSHPMGSGDFMISTLITAGYYKAHSAWSKLSNKRYFASGHVEIGNSSIPLSLPRLLRVQLCGNYKVNSNSASAKERSSRAAESVRKVTDRRKAREVVVPVTAERAGPEPLDPVEETVDGQCQDKATSTLPYFATSVTKSKTRRGSGRRQKFHKLRAPRSNTGDKAQPGLTILRSFWRAFFNPATSNVDLFDVYQQLPSPRINIIPARYHSRLLLRFMQVERKNEVNMRHYMTLIDDFKLAGRTNTLKQWNSVINFAGNHKSTVKEADVQAAFFFWREMEKTTGHTADITTFNVLFDIASRCDSGQYAELVLGEMRARGMKRDRYTYVNLITYYGARGDAPAIRKTYADMIEAGESIDTTVLNAVMSGLIAAGEPLTAEKILNRMKSNIGKTRTPPTYWRARRELGTVLKKLALLRKRLGESSLIDRNLVPLGPDMLSFGMFVSYHCDQTADFQQACAFLEDMASCNIVPDWGIYLALFKGFAKHSKLRFSPWTLDRLEIVFEEYKDAGTIVNKDLATWCLLAFTRLAGKQRAKIVREEVLSIWDGQDEDDKKIEIEKLNAQFGFLARIKTSKHGDGQYHRKRIR